MENSYVLDVFGGLKPFPTISFNVSSGFVADFMGTSEATLTEFVEDENKVVVTVSGVDVTLTDKDYIKYKNIYKQFFNVIPNNSHILSPIQFELTFNSEGNGESRIISFTNLDGYEKDYRVSEVVLTLPIEPFIVDFSNKDNFILYFHVFTEKYNSLSEKIVNHFSGNYLQSDLTSFLNLLIENTLKYGETIYSIKDNYFSICLEDNSNSISLNIPTNIAVGNVQLSYTYDSNEATIEFPINTPISKYLSYFDLFFTKSSIKVFDKY